MAEGHVIPAIGLFGRRRRRGLYRDPQSMLESITQKGSLKRAPDNNPKQVPDVNVRG